MTTRETEQTAVGRLEKKVAELTARLLRWQYFGTLKAIDLRETRIHLGHLLAREAELVGAAAAESEARGSQIESGSTPAPGSGQLGQEPSADRTKDGRGAEREVCVKYGCDKAPLVYLKRGESRQTANGFLIVKVPGWYCPKCAGSYGGAEPVADKSARETKSGAGAPNCDSATDG